MTESLLTFSVRRRQALADLLKRDPVGAAYLLADLEDPYFQHTLWYGAGPAPDRLLAVVLVYTALKTPALLTMGKAHGIEKIMIDHGAALPASCTCMIAPCHDRAVEKIYSSAGKQRMLRMGLKTDRFTSCDSGPAVDLLEQKDIPDLLNLMDHYPGNYFEAAMFRDGFYFGIHMDGRLVSAGGIHTYSPTYRVAAVGNIVTHGEYRRKGFALRCTSALVERLLPTVDHIALNVEAENRAAIHCYEKLGFQSHNDHTEGLFHKKDHKE